MYGGPGTLLRGPLGLTQTLSAVSVRERKPPPLQDKAPPRPHADADGRERAHQMWPCTDFEGRQMFKITLALLSAENCLSDTLSSNCLRRRSIC
jgi:hypothetical protein